MEEEHQGSRTPASVRFTSPTRSATPGERPSPAYRGVGAARDPDEPTRVAVLANLPTARVVEAGVTRHAPPSARPGDSDPGLVGVPASEPSTPAPAPATSGRALSADEIARRDAIRALAKAAAKHGIPLRQADGSVTPSTPKPERLRPIPTPAGNPAAYLSTAQRFPPRSSPNTDASWRARRRPRRRRGSSAGLPGRLDRARGGRPSRAENRKGDKKVSKDSLALAASRERVRELEAQVAAMRESFVRERAALRDVAERVQRKAEDDISETTISFLAQKHKLEEERDAAQAAFAEVEQTCEARWADERAQNAAEVVKAAGRPRRRSLRRPRRCGDANASSCASPPSARRRRRRASANSTRRPRRARSRSGSASERASSRSSRRRRRNGRRSTRSSSPRTRFRKPPTRSCGRRRWRRPGTRRRRASRKPGTRARRSSGARMRRRSGAWRRLFASATTCSRASNESARRRRASASRSASSTRRRWRTRTASSRPRARNRRSTWRRATRRARRRTRRSERAGRLFVSRTSGDPRRRPPGSTPRRRADAERAVLAGREEGQRGARVSARGAHEARVQAAGARARGGAGGATPRQTAPRTSGGEAARQRRSRKPPPPWTRRAPRRARRRAHLLPGARPAQLVDVGEV